VILMRVVLLIRPLLVTQVLPRKMNLETKTKIFTSGRPEGIDSYIWGGAKERCQKKPDEKDRERGKVGSGSGSVD